MGPQAGHIVDLWRVMLWTCSLVFGAILAALLFAILRAPRADATAAPDLSAVDRAEPRVRRSVASAAVASALLLFALALASVFTDRALARLSLAGAVNIEVTAHQWWWSARYLDGGHADTFVTANEIHIPVGRPVNLQLKADDVIHSLWVPSLAGKKDLIPGRSASMQFRADTPGPYRGQCAEFCGFQHALMGLLVVADPPAQYEAWVQAQRTPPAPPTGAKAIRGQQLFQSTSCAMCHAIGGTIASAQHAPDLTHLASRSTLAAGTLANTPAQLAAWIADPQKHKPGVNMPSTPISRDDLDALVAYLETLK
ncbi:c-type cytochrome [Caenimonas sp. DR4.4]|uniref:C-type cytochrome n=2 Tax=Caenimonas aquaedulcis TaxID=2793270 RepID=A0A931H301_9BURK|nr:c-type cytochrome [Caenimonas aquaedulcis]